MFLTYFIFIRSEILNQCEAFQGKDLSITLYTRNKCGPCDRIKPFIEEIDSRLERNGKEVKIRMVNCSECNCGIDNIKVVPELIITNDNVETARLTGFKEFGDIIEFLMRNTGIERNIFAKRIKSNPGNVVKLKENDFFTGFDGPWLVLFYNTKSDMKRELIKEIANEYESKLNIGEIDGNLVPNLMQRFGMSQLPALLALYNGLMVGYNNEDNLNEIREFVDELIRPSFTNLNFEEFEKIKNENQHPIFIIFYKDLNVANEYFKDLAHEYKFKARIYKSDDTKILQAANINLDNKDLSISVFKNKIFHECPYDVIDKEKMLEWIWNAHYPDVTRINNTNFYGIMHGLKPSIILLTKEEELLEEFENASRNIHKGMPFADQLFATIDVEVYSLFIPKLLPGIKIPYLVILDPSKEFFYTQKMDLKKENINEIVMEMVDKFSNNKLSRYPIKHSYYKIILLVSFAIGCLYLGSKAFMVKRYTIEEKFHD
ncbi:hypothetical protein GVAV_003282 [Gurleya vavrai]